MISDTTFVIGYTMIGLLLVAVAAWYNDRVTARYHEQVSKDKIFRCAQCGYVYTDDQDVSRSPCPQCRQFNDPIEF